MPGKFYLDNKSNLRPVVKRGGSFLPAGRGRPAGFTLIEVLVVASIFSIVALGLGGVLFSGVKLWQRAHDIGFIKTKVLLELEIISKRLRQSLDMPVIEFTGHSDRMEFPTVIGGEVFKVLYRFDAATKNFLYKKIKYEDVLAQQAGDYTDTVLFDADKGSFAYLVFDAAKQSYLWEDNLEVEGVVPAAVKINIEADGENFEKFVFIPVH